MNDTLIEAAKRDDNKYTAESWAVFAQAVSKAKELLEEGGLLLHRLKLLLRMQ